MGRFVPDGEPFVFPQLEAQDYKIHLPSVDLAPGVPEWKLRAIAEFQQAVRLFSYVRTGLTSTYII